MQVCSVGDHVGVAPVRATEDDQAEGLLDLDQGDEVHLPEGVDPLVLFTRDITESTLESGVSR